MKIALSIIASLFIVFNSWAQNSLKGKVTHAEEGTALEKASIYVPDLRLKALSDENGLYELHHLPKGKFLVECRKSEHLTITKYIEIQGETQLDFALEDEVVEINEVTVTGSSQSASLRENPLSLSTIDKNELLQNNATNLIDNVSKNPAVNQISTGNGISKPVIRGLGYNRIVSLNNGIRQEGQQWGDEHGIEIDEYAVDRVEIIKGPGSLMYGSDAIAGVINFLPSYPVVSGTIQTNFISNYQTNNGLQAYSLSNAGNIKGINWNVRGTYKQAGNYKNALDGYVMNSGFNEKNLNGSIGLNKKWGLTQIYMSSFNQEVGMTEGERDSLGNFILVKPLNDSIAEEISMSSDKLKGYHMELPRQKINHLRIGNLTKIYFKNSNLALNIAYQNNKRKELANAFDPEEPELFFDLHTWNYDARFNFNDFKGYSISVGANGMLQNNSNLAEEVIIPEYNLFDFGAYAFVKKTWNEKLHFAGGIRSDWRRIEAFGLYVDTLDNFTSTSNEFTTTQFKPLNKAFQALSGSLGISYILNEKAALKFNVARGFRTPNVAELTANGKHEGSLRYEIGNANLKPETSLQSDLGLVFNTEHVSTELSVFYNSIQNYIYAVKLKNSTGGDSIPDPEDPAPAFQFTGGNADLMGGEFSIDIHPHPLDWLHIENALSYVNGQLRNQPDSMTHLPFLPPMRYSGELRCEFSKLKKSFNHLFASFQVQHFFAQNNFYSAFGTETATPSYTLLNASLGFDLINKKGNTLVTFIASCNNIADVAFQSHLSRLKYAPLNPANGRTGVFNMGRNISFKLIVPIDIHLKK